MNDGHLALWLATMLISVWQPIKKLSYDLVRKKYVSSS